MYLFTWPTPVPGWPSYDLDRCATQRFDVPAEVLDDPMGDERALWDGIS